MSPRRPTISVVLPVYNGAEFLEQAVATVRAQTYQPLEVIIVDDGSTDATPSLAAALDLPFRLVRQENRGPSAARNRGLSEARGEAIAFLDVDDLWPEDKLAAQADALAKDATVDVVSGLVLIAPDDPERERLPERFRKPHRRVNLGASLVRRAAFEAVGQLDRSMRFAEDVEWFMRARERGLVFRFLDRVTLIYRRHPDNMTRDEHATRRGLFEALKKSLDRRGDAPGGASELAALDAASRPSASVSVIMPVHNGEDFIDEALDSIEAQTVRPLEVIVVDDGSTDGSSTRAAVHTGVRVVRQEQLGVGAARNRGVSEASGDYVAFLDADDLWPPDKLERQLAAFERQPDLDLVFGSVVEFRGQPPLGQLASSSAAQPGQLPSALLGRRRAFDRIGPLATRWTVGAFMDWLLRARELGVRQGSVPEVVLLRRLHGDNLGVRARDRRGDYFQIIKAALDRRRGRGE